MSTTSQSPTSWPETKWSALPPAAALRVGDEVLGAAAGRCGQARAAPRHLEHGRQLVVRRRAERYAERPHVHVALHEARAPDKRMGRQARAAGGGAAPP